MTLDELLNQAIAWIIARKKIITVIFVGLIGIYLLFRLITSFAIVFVEIKSTFQPSNTTIYSSSGRGTFKSIGLFNTAIIPRDTKSIIVTSDTSVKTQTKITIPWYGLTTKKVTLVRDKNADKIAYTSISNATCATYARNVDKLSFFTCKKPSTLTQSEAPLTGPWGSKKIADLAYTTDRITDFMGGLIGVIYQEGSDANMPGELAFVTETGKINYYRSPDGLDLSKLTQTRIFTDASRPDNNRFVLVDTTSGDIYLATLIQNNSAVEYRRIVAPVSYNPNYNQTLCAINNDLVYCYQGLGLIGEGSPPDEVLKDQITSLSFNSDSLSSQPINDQNVLQGFYVTSDGTLFGKNYKRLLNFKQEAENYIIDELSQNIDGAVAGDNLYFMQDNGIFKIDTQTKDAYQVFYSPNIIPKRIYISAGKIFIIGNVNGVDSIAYAYQLNDQDNASPIKRLIDILPTSSNNIPETLTNDVVGDRINIVLKMSRGERNVEFEDRKLNALEFLRSKEVPVSENNIEFSY